MSGMQSNPLMLTFEAPDSSAKLFLRGYSGREAVSELFEFDLDLLLPAGESVAFEKLLGKSATVVVERGRRSGRVINGILCELEEVADGGAFTAFRAKLVPQVWRRTLNRNSRIFQQTSVPDVLKHLFPASMVEFRLRSAYDPHNFCVQYQESDFAFASRLMEEEGIFYFFEHERNGHKMIIADDSTTVGAAHSVAVRFDSAAGGTRSDDRIYHWAKKQRLGATRFRVADHQFQLPRENFSNALEKMEGKQVAAGSVHHALCSSLNDEIEIYDHTPGFSHCYDGVGATGSDQPADLVKTYDESKRVASLRLQEMASQTLRIQCQSDCAELGSGSRFELKGHPNADGAYLVLRVEHDVTQASPVAEAEERGHFANRLTCQPADLSFRAPLTTPKPSARAQSAVVVGPAGEEIFTDKFGRVKVQFQWDRLSGKDPKSSCWLRVVQPWAGSGFGHISIPRIGQEVVVDFFHGDPDMPFIVGSVHNPDEPTPRPLPDCRSQTVFKSRTKFGAANEFNGFGMDDTPDSEHLQLQAQKYMTTNVKDIAFSNYGSGHHEMHGSVYSRRVGGLPIINYQETAGASPGSGAGGGAPVDSVDAALTADAGSGSGGESNSESPNSGPFQWSASVMGSWADNLEFTVGRKSDGVAGISTAVTIGTKTNTVINPFGLAWCFAKTGGGETATEGVLNPIKPAAGLKEFFTGMPVAGNVAAIFGTSTTLIYGPSIKVTRGHNVDKKLSFTKKPDLAWTKAAKGAFVLSGLYAIFRVVEQFNFLASSSMTTQNIEGAVASVVELGLLDGWTILEMLGPPSAKAEKAKNDAENILKSKLGSNEVVQQVGPLLNKVEVQQPVGEIKNDIQLILPGNKVDDSQQVDEKGVNDDELIDGERKLFATSVKIASMPGKDDQNAGVFIDSYGPGGDDGVILVNSTELISCSAANKAAVLLGLDNFKKGKILLDCDSDGSIVLQSGANQKPNALELDADGGVSVMSTLGINLFLDSDHEIDIDPEKGITIESFDDSNKIVLSKNSLSLVRGSNSIEINDDGIVINAKSIQFISSGKMSMDAGATNWKFSGLTVKSPQTEWDGPAIKYKPN